MNSQMKFKIFTSVGGLIVGWMLDFLLIINPVFAQTIEQNLEVKSISSEQAGFARLAKNIPIGGQIILENLPISGMHGNQRLLLERFPIFAPDAVIITSKGERLPVPDNAYYRGQVEGLSDSIVLMTVPEQGQPRGLIFASNRIMVLEGRVPGHTTGLDTREVDVETELEPLARKFRCDAETLHQPENSLLNRILGEVSSVKNLPDKSQSSSVAGYTINLAVETDYEYYALFNSQTAALNYLSDLIAYASVIYEREIGTHLQISYTKLWIDGPNSDPWAATSTSALLGELLSYWNANNSNVNRATVHMLSGRQFYSGIAYVGTLCDKQYGYGVTTSIQGNFNINNPSIVWDIIAVSHELGHNFGSQHTHCYAGIGSNANDVDHCYGQESGCYAGTQTLPGINSLTGGAAGGGGGTIMSYCHLLSGGMNNLALTFGQNHPYGIAANRVSNLMSAFVAGSPASCTTSTVYTLTVSKVGAGSGTVGGGGSYAAGATVALIATPNAGSVFAGWSPSPCAASFAMPASNLTCTATFTLNTYTLTVAKAGTGSGTVGGGGTFPYNTLVTPTATAATGSTFTGWSPVSCGAPFNLTANTTCTATFSPVPTYTLTVAKAGAGSGTVGGGGSYAAGATVALTATPEAGSVFAGWSPSPCAASFAMPASNLSCTATFNPSNQTPAQHTVGLFSPGTSTFYLKNSPAGGAADIVFGFGPPNAGWTPLVGDWDGNGTATAGLFSPATSTFYLKNSHGGGAADLVFGFGPANAGWTPLVGDWDGNGSATVGLFSPGTSTFYLKNSHAGGAADLVFGFGPANAGWKPLAGDWNGPSQ